jgi:hypothetical protein
MYCTRTVLSVHINGGMYSMGYHRTVHVHIHTHIHILITYLPAECTHVQFPSCTVPLQCQRPAQSRRRATRRSQLPSNTPPQCNATQLQRNATARTKPEASERARTSGVGDDTNAAENHFRRWALNLTSMTTTSRGRE